MLYWVVVSLNASGQMSQHANSDCIQPHPPLPGYHTSAAARAAVIRTLFNRTAAQYDRINCIFSLGSGAWYRRRALLEAGLQQGLQVLDVAVGTGLVAREAARICGAACRVTGLDVSENMLAIARRSLGIPVIQGRAENLPVADASMDFVTMGYALRHVVDLAATFREFRRVLRPGGRVLILEISRPVSAPARTLAQLYFRQLVPAVCRLLSAGEEARDLMRYYWDTIEACVPPPVILAALAGAGFESHSCDTALGLFRAYEARKLDVAGSPADGAVSPVPDGRYCSRYCS